MADGNKSFSWETAVAIAGLVVSLFGNWVQYKSLDATKIKLAQSQAQLDAAYREAQAKVDRQTRKRADMENRMQELDNQIQQENLEERRGEAGVAFAPIDQKPMALEIINQARANREKLFVEKQKLQDKIDALSTD